MALPAPNPGIFDIAPYIGGKSQAAPGTRVIKLASNENPLGPSPKAIEAYKSVADRLHRYPDGSAIELREAIAEVKKLPVKQLVCGAGSDELIGLLIHAYARAGDDIVMSRHGFLMYKIYAQGFGVNAVMAAENNLCADVDAMVAAITPKTKLVFLANPNNPTGSYVNREALQRLHKGIPAHVLLVLDNAYTEYVEDTDYSDGSDLVAASQNVVTLQTFSKIYGLPSLRLGWAYAPAPVIDVLNRIRGPFNVNSPAIAAGIAAIRDQDYVAHCRAHNTKWRAWLTQEIGGLGHTVYPGAGNFLLVEFADEEQRARVNAHLMREGIIPRETVAYGLPKCLRITVGTEDENKALIAALKTHHS